MAAGLVPAGSVPEHVPRRLVIDYDYFNDERYKRFGGIPEAMAALREEAPDVFWSTKLGGYWVIQGYAEVVDAANRTTLFSSSHMQIPPGPRLADFKPAVPLMIDPPDHAMFRRPLTEAFSPKAMAARKDAVRQLAIDLIDKIVPLGACDFFETVAEPLPVQIFMQLMGMDMSRFREFRILAQKIVSEADQQKRALAGRQIYLEMQALIAARRLEPQDDLVSRLISTRLDDKPVPDDILAGYCNLLFAAGLDTVANAMGFCVRYLARDQALQQRLRDQPQMQPLAIEEIMRRHAPAPVTRIVTQDMIWRGVDLRKGDMALLLYPSANLDEAVFADASGVHVDRERINHLAFGSGPHRCVGRHLARIEIQVMLEELLLRLPTFRPDPDKPEAMHGGSVMSMDSLPIVWSVAG